MSTFPSLATPTTPTAKPKAPESHRPPTGDRSPAPSNPPQPTPATSPPSPPSPPRTWTWVSVHDAGLGLDSSELVQLFQPFVQLNSAFNRRYAARNLGAALVQTLTQLHGITVFVHHSGEDGVYRIPPTAYKPRMTTLPK